MARLSEEKRDRLPDRDFAYIDKKGERHLPIENAEHVRAAMARWNQTDFESQSAKEKARKKILTAAKKYDIEVSPDDKIAKAA